MGKTVQKVRMGIVAVGLLLMFANAGHPLGARQDMGMVLAIEVLVQRKSALSGATFVMGGVVYRYTEQDWSCHQAALVDALTETRIGMMYAPTGNDRQHLSAGYSLLLARVTPPAHRAHCSQLSLFGLRATAA